MLIIICR